MVDQVPSTVARTAQGADVTTAALRGEEEYYPESISYINNTDTLQHLVLLTTNTGYAVQGTDWASCDGDIEGSPYRLNVMGISNERVLLISEGPYTSESDCRSIQIESIHGTSETDSHVLTVFTEEALYTINTAKSHRILDFRAAIAYLATCIEGRQ